MSFMAITRSTRLIVIALADTTTRVYSCTRVLDKLLVVTVRLMMDKIMQRTSIVRTRRIILRVLHYYTRKCQQHNNMYNRGNPRTRSPFSPFLRKIDDSKCTQQ
jgi:hypothetical protein